MFTLLSILTLLISNYYTLNWAFCFCRVKLKHFEKFNDTTEALAGTDVTAFAH